MEMEDKPGRKIFGNSLTAMRPLGILESVGHWVSHA